MDLAVLRLSYSFSSWPMVSVSKIVINFNTGAFIPATLNSASYKANPLSASCDQKGSNLKLKFEAKLSLLAKNVFFYWLIDHKNQVVYQEKLATIFAEFSIILQIGFKSTSRLVLRNTFRHNLVAIRKKLSSRVTLLRQLIGSGWGAGAKTLRTAALSLVYSTAEYCAPAWCRSAYIRLLHCLK